MLLSTANSTSVIPTAYKISVSVPNSTAYICRDKELDVATDISVEKESAFTGNYPGGKAAYKKLSRHAYKKSLRKMVKVQKKQEKTDHITGVVVKK